MEGNSNSRLKSIKSLKIVNIYGGGRMEQFKWICFASNFMSLLCSYLDKTWGDGQSNETENLMKFHSNFPVSHTDNRDTIYTWLNCNLPGLTYAKSCDNTLFHFGYIQCGKTYQSTRYPTRHTNENAFEKKTMNFITHRENSNDNTE